MRNVLSVARILCSIFCETYVTYVTYVVRPKMQGPVPPKLHRFLSLEIGNAAPTKQIPSVMWPLNYGYQRIKLKIQKEKLK